MDGKLYYAHKLINCVIIAISIKDIDYYHGPATLYDIIMFCYILSMLDRFLLAQLDGWCYTYCKKWHANQKVTFHAKYSTCGRRFLSNLFTFLFLASYKSATLRHTGAQFRLLILDRFISTQYDAYYAFDKHIYK